MATGKCDAYVNIDKLSIKIGNYNVFTKGSLDRSYNEENIANYMKNKDIEITINLGLGKKSFTAYTMDLTKRYIDINSDYRT